MTFRRNIWPRIVSILCVMAVLALAPQAATAGLDDLRHSVHGDVAASDGGWVVADCDSDDGSCVLGHDGGVDAADGHHHHGSDTHATALLTSTPGLAAAGLTATRKSPALASRLDDADVRQPGRVPRASIRLI